MTLHWTFVLYSLYLEVAFASLLMVPYLSTLVAHGISFMQRNLLSSPIVALVKWLVCLFITQHTLQP